ncbi:hypothetical protein ACQ9LF_08770 [Anaerohalosphaeraceae bacterium U12dextr]
MSRQNQFMALNQKKPAFLKEFFGIRPGKADDMLSIGLEHDCNHHFDKGFEK